MVRARVGVDLASIVAMVVLLVAGLLLGRANRNEALAWQWVTHTREVLERLQQVVSLVSTAESAQRGHLLTGRPSDLADMQAAQRAVPGTIDAIASLTQDNPRQQHAVPALRQLTQARLDDLVAMSESRDDLLGAGRLEPGSELMHALAGQVAAMMDEEQRLLAARQAEVESARRLELATTVAVALLAVGLVGLLRTVSRRDARVIEQAASRVSAVFQAAPAGLGIVDTDLRLAELNDALAQFFGTSRAAALGRRPAELQRCESTERLQAICAESLSSGARRTDVALVQRVDGAHPRDWLASFHVVDGAQGRTGVVMAVLDVTSLKEAERQLAQANQLLESRVEERTAQLTVVNEDLQAFAHTVAHDLRAPLRNVEGFASALLEDESARLSEIGQAYLGRIQAGVQRMDQLITDLLSYSRLARGELSLERVSLGAAVAHALRELDRTVRARGAEVEVPADLPQVVAHRSLLVQVLVNLLTNALKFVPENERPHVRIQARREGSCVRISVADNGIGIAPQHRDRVFGVFERLHGQEAFPGTGIGLAIVRRAVAKMNGAVSVADSPLGGVSLQVTLPAPA